MIVKDIIDRLSGTGSPFRIVEGANELAEVKDRPATTPAAYVYVASEASKPSERFNGPVLQRLEMDIAVVIVTDNNAGALQVADDIESLKAFVRGRLLGYVSPSAFDPIEHVLGQVAQIKDHMVWFEDVFATAKYLQEQP